MTEADVEVDELIERQGSAASELRLRRQADVDRAGDDGEERAEDGPSASRTTDRLHRAQRRPNADADNRVIEMKQPRHSEADSRPSESSVTRAFIAFSPC